MSFLPSRPTPLWLQSCLVMLLAWMGMAALFGHTAWADWAAPHWLDGDVVEVYARVRIATDQPQHALLPFASIERLGAPAATADWSAYPVPDRLVFVLTGLVARATGLIAAVHVAAALITGLNALSFFLCARWLRWRWEWAAALALVFAFCTYNVRLGITLSLNQTFVLPPLVLLCAHAARRGTRALRTVSWTILGAGLGLWLGFANPYLAFFAGIVGGGALLLGLGRRNPAARRRPLLVFLGCLALSFGLGNAGAITAHLRGETAESLVRGPGDLHVYALRPAEWLVPPADHRVPALARLGQDYFSARRGVGEFFNNYLGFAGLLGLAGLLVRGGRALLRRQTVRAEPLLGLVWITVFGVAGGLNTWLGAAGFYLFRASTRIGIYAVVWALLHLGGRIALLRHPLPRAASLGLATLVALAAVWDQTPMLADRAASDRNLARWRAVAALTDRLAQELPPEAMVFQLPVVPFPEAGPIGTMTDYQHFLPFLTSHSLHFSYGQMRPSPWFRWARYVGRLPADELVEALERAGFSALWVDPRADPEAASALAARLRSLGRQELAGPTPQLPVHVFRLNPAATPVAPDLHDPRLNDPWDTSARDNLLALEGWYPLERNERASWRWAVRSARAGFWHDGPAGSATLRFRVDGPARSTVVLRQGGREVWRGRAGGDPVSLQLPVTAGLNPLDWTLEGPTFRPGDHDPRELGFMVENLSLSVP